MKLLIAFILAFPLTAQTWSGILDPTRATDWSSSGVNGGIPATRTQCVNTQCAAVTSAGASATNTQINAAIQNATSNTYVLLAAGTYNIGTGGGPGCGNGNGIQMCGKSNVTLRGAGADQTLLVFTNDNNCHGGFSVICVDSSDTNWQGGPSNTANWTANYTQGTTTITLDSHTNLKVGNPLILDQVDDASDTGNIFVCQSTTTSPPCSLEGNINNGQRPNRDQVQIVRVASCGTSTPGATCTSSTVTISPGIRMPNWNSVPGTSLPQAWWATTPVSGVGIENLSIDSTNDTGARGFEFFNAIDCWVSGVRSIDTGKSHIELSNSTSITLQNNYFYLTQNAVSQSYGISSFSSSDVLAVNNISQYVAAPWTINGSCTGCVLAYNYSINDYYTASAGYVAPASNQHTAGIDMLLYEGNIGAGSYGDNFHGTHNMITFFRNQWVGNQPKCYNGSPNSFSACTSNQVPFIINSYSRFYNIIGNVLGQSGVHNTYQNSGVNIYNFGSGNTEGSVTVPSDSLVGTTMMRWGNYDTVTAAVRWCGNSGDTGWSTTCSSTSEVPTGLSLYANAVPSTETLPPSFYYSAKPGWWPAAKSWPPIGPDVTGGNIANLNGHAYTIPSEDCYLNIMNGPADGTGSVLTFNAATCYSSSPPVSTVAICSGPCSVFH